MSAYLIVEHKITDTSKFEAYMSSARPMILKHGGRYLTKPGSHELLEDGHWKPDRTAIIEFRDMPALNAWYNSSEYQSAIGLRDECISDIMLIALEGA